MKYNEAGVSREGGYEIVDRIREYTTATHDRNVMNGVGDFGGLYRLGTYDDPVLVSGTDGVGTKLHLAAAVDYLEGIGIDCVAMCVNDILCHGAAPLFFLDYLAYADLPPSRAARIVHGVSLGCRQAGCSLIGGESAQMPGTYRSGDFDLAGFAVGVVESGRIISGKKIHPGDYLIGLDSSGVHSNGFSLIRALLKEKAIELDAEFEGGPLWKTLLEPTRIYVQPVLPLVEAGLVRGLAHITGGGLYENVPRMFPAGGSDAAARGYRAVIRRKSIHPPGIFDYIRALGVDEEEMFHTFNMGIGMVCASAPENSASVIEALKNAGVNAWTIGRVEEESEGVREICFD